MSFEVGAGRSSLREPDTGTRELPTPSYLSFQLLSSCYLNALQAPKPLINTEQSQAKPCRLSGDFHSPPAHDWSAPGRTFLTDRTLSLCATQLRVHGALHLKHSGHPQLQNHHLHAAITRPPLPLKAFPTTLGLAKKVISTSHQFLPMDGAAVFLIPQIR